MKSKNYALIVLGLLLIGACVAFAVNAVSLHELEVAEQVAKIGYYKEDVYLNFERHLTFEVLEILAVLSGALGVGAFFVSFAKITR